MALRDLTIRKATAEDAPAVWAIRNAAIRHACRGFYADDLLAQWTAGEISAEFVACVAQQFYVATSNGLVTGSGFLDVTEGQLEAVFVRPELMGQGIGKRLVAFCEDLGRRAGLTQLKLDATLNAAPFYRRCGYVGDTIAVYRSPRGISLACIPMTKGLAEPLSTP